MCDPSEEETVASIALDWTTSDATVPTKDAEPNAREQAHSDGGRTGEDPEADPLAPPGGTAGNIPRSLRSCATPRFGSTMPTEVIFYGPFGGLRNTARPSCVLKVQQQGSISHKTLVSFDPERQL
ncbi:conserved hypothetical protein [Trichinella spiralis]|uniref:hypothetical protein n=1 Tax=Trichinella spiralis TaxID=6334 RepID=UPI0001EFE2CB|nr:conserved hypothetical protein [Trichinella spiralis]